MVKKRVIPVLFLQNGLIVRSEGFNEFKVIGNPINQLERYSDWDVDELIYIDITRQGEIDSHRDEHKVPNHHNLINVLKEIRKVATFPITFGGRIKTIEDVDKLIANGADKVVINTACFGGKELVERVAHKYGSQCMVAGIDYEEPFYKVCINQGKVELDRTIWGWGRELVERGAGELFLNNITRDGKANGFNIGLSNLMANCVNVPVLSCGGAGIYEDFFKILSDTDSSAACAGNIFHFTELAYPRVKKLLKEKGINVR